MDGLRSGLRRLIATARRGGSARHIADVVSPHNVVVSINDERPGSVNAVSARQTVIDHRRSHPPESTTQGRRTMADPTRTLTDEDLEAEDASELPDREAMSLVDANVAAPINAAVAANVLSNDSTATADADQENDIEQDA
jgi:hypothetical protein